MKLKSIATVVLLAFVAASIGYLVVKETGGRPTQAALQSNDKLPSQEQHKESPVPSEAGDAGQKVIVYYFHGNVRCITCVTIESYAKEAVEEGFPEALSSGRVEWRVVNVEEPGNDHYVRDFQLTTRSVVVERLVDGKEKEWKNLQRVWELIRGDKEDFLKYIQDETKGYLEAEGT